MHCARKTKCNSSSTSISKPAVVHASEDISTNTVVTVTSNTCVVRLVKLFQWILDQVYRLPTTAEEESSVLASVGGTLHDSTAYETQVGSRLAHDKLKDENESKLLSWKVLLFVVISNSFHPWIFNIRGRGQEADS